MVLEHLFHVFSVFFESSSSFVGEFQGYNEKKEESNETESCVSCQSASFILLIENI